MNISESAASLVSDIKEFSGGKLKYEKDVLALIEASLSGENRKLFDEMIFTAKYLNGLGKILHSNQQAVLTASTDSNKIDENAEEKIRNEFMLNMNKLSAQISKLITVIPAEDKKIFEEKYLALNRTSLVNLTNLIYDLSWVKNYFNSKK